MQRQIITIDEEKCNGCGACASACHEGAIEMVNGKARLMRDDYCDGLGDCLPACPTNAISFVIREAAAYDEAAVRKNKEQKQRNQEKTPLPCGCPGSQSRKIGKANSDEKTVCSAQSQLSQWPVQIKLVPINAPYFDGANLLVAADCTAYAYAVFHEKFIKNHITLIGCPKLDDIDYSEKLAQILRTNDIKSISVVRMEVPCCGGIVHAVKNAIAASGKLIPHSVTIISANGDIIEQ